MKKDSSEKCVCRVDRCGCAPRRRFMGQEKKRQPRAAPKLCTSAILKWTPIFKGCELATVAGDPSGRRGAIRGAPSVRLMEPRFPAHWHPTDENANRVEGDLF